MTFVWLAGIAVLALAGCRRAEAPEGEAKGAESKPAQDETQEAFTFGFETRDHQLFLHTATDPQLYTVKTRDGKTLAEGIDDARLEREFPALHELLHGESELIDVIDY